jgi:hypothetical protein
MKLNERCSGPGFDSRHLHQKHIKSLFEGRKQGHYSIHETRTNMLLMGGVFGFDRAMSKDMDNTVGDDRKSSKTITANAANDEVYALAA